MIKQVTFALFAVFFLIGCGADTATLDCEPPEQGSMTSLQVVFASDDYSVNHNRMSVLIYDGADIISAESVKAELYSLTADGNSDQLLWSGDATSYTDYEVPYSVIQPEFTEEGQYGLLICAKNGESEGLQQRLIDVPAKSRSVQTGDAGIPSDSPTATTEEEIRAITSDKALDGRLYNISIADAIASGKPTIISFSTPAFCQTKICAPVLDGVKSLKDTYGDDIHTIHIEVFENFSELVVAESMTEWGLTTEPWTYVVDGNGTVVGRYGGPVSPSELSKSLTPLLEAK